MSIIVSSHLQQALVQYPLMPLAPSQQSNQNSCRLEEQYTTCPNHLLMILLSQPIEYHHHHTCHINPYVVNKSYHKAIFPNNKTTFKLINVAGISTAGHTELVTIQVIDVATNKLQAIKSMLLSKSNRRQSKNCMTSRSTRIISILKLKMLDRS